MKFFFLIPVYNEADNIELLSNNLKNCIESKQERCYIFVDDCSSDNSIELIKQYFEGYDYHIITKQVNGGPGDSFNKGFEYIIQQSSSAEDIVITLEADNTSDLNILKDMTEISKLGYDLVLASVYAQGGGFEKTSTFRKLFSTLANLVIRFIFNIKILTLSSFYRIYKVSFLKKIKEKYNIIIEERGFISMVEILIKSICLNAKIIEVPMVLCSDKRVGKSKMKVFKTMISYLKFLLKKKQIK
ncbi:MAG: hypothetical protein A2X12_08425 [Bacteroidetes bacterium GWE2_29_8]|nr:MAG: hypothetical protein A2X12_08425 [Bacteroidetes bacterium GWE2_29_8]OFY15896.1 MAG: hypothetical protein A2X02_04850 [Bacteroidetes bacterium GWF2_29_10]